MVFLEIIYLSSTGLEITIVLRFFENFLEFLNKKKNTVNLKILKISEKSNGRFSNSLSFSEAVHFREKVREFYTEHFKDLKPKVFPSNLNESRFRVRIFSTFEILMVRG